MSDRNNHIHRVFSQNFSREEVYLQLLQSGYAIDEIQHVEKLIKQETRDLNAIVLRTLLVFGAVCIVLGVFSFVVASWSSLVAESKVALVVTGVFISYGISYIFTRSQQSIYQIVFLLLGHMILGVGMLAIFESSAVSFVYPNTSIWLIWCIALWISWYIYPIFWTLFSILIVQTGMLIVLIPYINQSFSVFTDISLELILIGLLWAFSLRILNTQTSI